MNSTQTEALIGMLFVLGILVLLVLPALFGVVHDWRIDRQIREAERSREPTPRPAPRRRAQGFVTSTVTHHS